jgi:hypothetical protein
MNCKGYSFKESLPDLRHYHGICMEVLKENCGNLMIISALENAPVRTVQHMTYTYMCTIHYKIHILYMYKLLLAAEFTEGYEFYKMVLSLVCTP